MRRSLDFFQVGGTLSADAPSYIERPADSELLAAIERHQFCLVLGPRQMGKSSLMIHAMTRLKTKGITFGYVDLQHLGSSTDFENWFVNVIEQIKRRAQLKTDTNAWWKAKGYLGPTQRFMAFIEDVVLREVNGDIVLAFDEIDSVLNLPFADDFFTLIRALYNSRSVNPSLERLTIVLLGVATPSSFIKDPTRTPFNIGESITLTDFDIGKTKPFQDVLGWGSKELVDRIFYWTNGQPLMVQRLAAAAYSWPAEQRSSGNIDREVLESYLQLKIEQDAHFKFLQDYLLDPASNTRKTLLVYRDVLLGKSVMNDERSAAQDRLKLSGIVRVEDGMLVSRNRIYRNIFNLQWTDEHVPVNMQKWVAYGASISVIVMLIALLWTANKPTNDGSMLGRPLRVGVVSWPGYAGGIVANNGFKPNKDSMYWKNYKQTVEFLLLEDIDVRNRAFARGGPEGVDIVWSTVDFWANELPNFERLSLKAKAIMQVDWSRGGDAIVVDQSIKSIEDLKGKKISLALFTPSHWLLESNLKNSRLDDSEQAEIVKNLVGKNASPDARQDFIAGKVDATVVWEPDVTEALKRPGSHILISSKDADRLIADLMVAREDFIKENPKVIKAFVQGWLEGTKEANRNPGQVVKLLMDNEPVYTELGGEGTRRSLATVKWADLTDNTEMFGLDGQGALFDTIFQYASQSWVKYGYITSPVSPDRAKDATFLKQIYDASPVQRPIGPTFNPESVATKTAVTDKPLNIFFASGRSELDANAQHLLDNEIGPLTQTFSTAYIRIEGNTDNVGDPELSRQLSLARAQAVANYLVRRYNFPPSRFIVVGNGPDKPRESNATAEGRAANRRIDIQVVVLAN